MDFANSASSVFVFDVCKKGWGRDDPVFTEVSLELAAHHTLFDVCSLVCSEWLDALRHPDGGVYQHLWKFTFGGREWVGPEDFQSGLRQDESESTKLEELGLVQGSVLNLEYDFGSTSYVSLVVSEQRLGVPKEQTALLPRRVPEAPTAEVTPHVPSATIPSLDEVFPHLAKLAMAPTTSSVLFFNPGGVETAAALEAGPNAMADLLFAPESFADAEELLIACDRASALRPPDGCREDAFARLVFPSSLSPVSEAKYAEFKADLDGYEAALRAAGVSDDIVMSLPQMMSLNLSEEHAYRMMGPKEAIVRATKEELAADVARLRGLGFDFAAAFPNCAAAARSRSRWIFLRNGVLMVCSGAGVNGEERGAPAAKSGVLGRVRKKFASLQELFCTAEALFPADDV